MTRKVKSRQQRLRSFAAVAAPDSNCATRSRKITIKARLHPKSNAASESECVSQSEPAKNGSHGGRFRTLRYKERH
jgi:hypothetical protein